MSENSSSLLFKFIYDFFIVQMETNKLLKFQPCLVSTFAVIAIDSKTRKAVDLYNDHTDECDRCLLS